MGSWSRTICAAQKLTNVIVMAAGACAIVSLSVELLKSSSLKYVGVGFTFAFHISVGLFYLTPISDHTYTFSCMNYD